jgi:hypothetical protein
VNTPRKAAAEVDKLAKSPTEPMMTAVSTQEKTIEWVLITYMPSDFSVSVSMTNSLSLAFHLRISRSVLTTDLIYSAMS